MGDGDLAPGGGGTLVTFLHYGMPLCCFFFFFKHGPMEV